MNYLSVCSGIEAVTVAWDSLGFNPIGYSEIDKFCCELLKQKYPQTLNYGDINGHSKWEINKPVDILVGGTPCQSFSIAGLRKGLEDPRGGIMLKFLEIVRDRKPRWIVWENVPGVLSSNKGRDFGTFLGSLGNLGYGFAYRILDAQWFGLAQRRKRVFVVGCIGDWENPAKVLFKSESLCGNNSESRKKEQKITGNIAPSLTASNDPSRSPQSSEITQQVNAVLNAQLANCLQTSSNDYSRADGFNMVLENQAVTQASDDISGTMQAKSSSGYSLNYIKGVQQQMAVRRLTPIECERLQGFPDNYTAISWGKKSSDQCPDGLRYKALGNSMAVPVVKWIGERIKMFDCPSE